ncbi:MAG: DEAD-box ATP-dependent RNA helicase 28-like [Trebouxia sp. A1-2]|nr:MAG: DEAD-box ATP-dependent RNA helicase 28-like [Trebouxia sp. A1-2]
MVRAVTGSDLNPDFSFDFGAGLSPAQAPWEMSGAAGQAVPARGSSLDDKIQRRVQARNERGNSLYTPQSGGNAIPLGKRTPAPAEDAFVDNSDSSSGSDSDEPLPGELDSDDGDDAQFDSSSDSQLQLPNDGLSDSDSDQPAAGQPSHSFEDAPAAGPSGRSGEPGYFAQTPDGTRFSAQSFSDLNLSRPLVKACDALGYTNPTPIQAACVPLALTGRDICGSAVTGSGKTAAFALPILERLLYRPKRVAAIYALVLTPTRELAVQVHSMIEKLAQATDIRAALVVGGLSMQVQASTLKTSPEIVVATPGRLIDHLRNTQSVGLEDLQALVLDEADRLLEMGFAEEIKEIVKLAPRKRQTLLFSATMTEQVQQLVTMSLKSPVRLAADAAGRAPEELRQEIVRLKGNRVGDKEAILVTLCSRSFRGGKTIVFFRTKQRAHRAKIVFGLAGLPPAAELHGNMSQSARLESLDKFRKGEVGFLLATDVAARGLDILGVEAVINYDSPPNLASYLHRIGRTARAGRQGRAVSLIEDSDRALVKEVVKKGRVQLQNRLVHAGPVHEWVRRIDDLQPDIDRVLQDEREERELRKVEMQTQKAENMIEHEAEIYARPPRTWFQTEKQKKESAKRGRPDADEEDVGARGKKAKKQKKEEGKGKKEKGSKEDKGRKQKDPLIKETKEAKNAVRAIKSQEAKFRGQGLAPGQAGKAAAAAALNQKGVTPKKSQKQKERDKKKKGQEGLFEGDGVHKPGAGFKSSRVYAGGPKSGKVKAPAGGKASMSKRDKNKVRRGGKGANAFKSKAKHKRRN